MKKIKAIIIDDEKPARDLIRHFLGDHQDIEVIGEAENGFEGYKMIVEMQPELIFLDVQMPKLSGFEMLELLDHPLPQIIFSTAYDQYAVRAFERHAIDYLLKPYNRDRFADAIKKFLELADRRNEYIPPASAVKEREGPLERIPVRSGSRILILTLDQIKYIKAEDDYVKIVSLEGKYLKQMTMAYLEKALPDNRFVRIHRSYILNIDFLKQLDVYDRQGYTVVTRDQERLPVSRSGASRLNALIRLK